MSLVEGDLRVVGEVKSDSVDTQTISVARELSGAGLEWTSFTPEISGPVAITYGFQQGRYLLINKTLFLSVFLTVGTITPGAGNYGLILPAGLLTAQQRSGIGSFEFTQGTQQFQGSLTSSGTSNPILTFRVMGSTDVTASPPVISFGLVGGIGVALPAGAFVYISATLEVK